MPEEMVEVAASPAEEKLAILLQPAEGEILSEGEFADFTEWTRECEELIATAEKKEEEKKKRASCPADRRREPAKPSQ